MLKIFGRVSSINVRKVLWCCDELAIPYSREDWGSGFRSTHGEEFLKLNPNGLIPVIDDDGFPILPGLRQQAVQRGRQGRAGVAGGYDRGDGGRRTVTHQRRIGTRGVRK